MVRAGIESLVATGYLPLLSIINEPAKVLFLNNAIDQGVYYPLGMQDTAVNGRSVFFMVASNPGPGLGILLAFSLFGQGMSKKSAPGAMIIHFLGGIHELYFPYVLMKPLMIIAMIAGGMAGIYVFDLMGAGFGCRAKPGFNLCLSGSDAAWWLCWYIGGRRRRDTGFVPDCRTDPENREKAGDRR
ncbi:EIICBA-Mtl [Serratia fonticola]|uniref:EIICBA-Mtl n=1 Tax=Serratia fonticola TaxID=47917 RepID=A0A4U9U206_SERFO|nr:EIICBA-Mtl [Serratia fonticola]